jgi:hypothetical protein
MRLLDAAMVNPSDRWAARWRNGYDGVSRECAVMMHVEDPCPTDPADFEADDITLIGDVDSRPGQYRVSPMAIRSYLRQSVFCEQDDDKDWVRRAVAAKAEYVLGRAMVEQLTQGGETWIGTAGVQNAATLAAARNLWETTVVSPLGQPILHVPPSMAPNLVTTGALVITEKGDAYSVFGGPVVINAGYEKATPQMFLTGEIIIRLADVDIEGVDYDHRINNYTLTASQWAAIDLAPCAIVRVGA